MAKHTPISPFDLQSQALLDPTPPSGAAHGLASPIGDLPPTAGPDDFSTPLPPNFDLLPPEPAPSPAPEPERKPIPLSPEQKRRLSIMLRRYYDEAMRTYDETEQRRSHRYRRYLADPAQDARRRALDVMVNGDGSQYVLAHVLALQTEMDNRSTTWELDARFRAQVASQRAALITLIRWVYSEAQVAHPWDEARVRLVRTPCRR